MMGGRTTACVAALLGISGCSNTTSDNVTTGGIHADIDVFADGSGTTVVDVELEVGRGGIGRTSLELGPGDTLTATAGGLQKAMTEHASVLGRYRHECRIAKCACKLCRFDPVLPGVGLRRVDGYGVAGSVACRHERLDVSELPLTFT